MWYNNNTYFKFIQAESGTYKLTFINIYRATSQATYYDVIFDKPLQSTEGASEPSILTIDPIDDITMNSLNGSLPRVTIRDENGDIVTGKTKTYTCEALSEYGASINSSDRYSIGKRHTSRYIYSSRPKTDFQPKAKGCRITMLTEQYSGLKANQTYIKTMDVVQTFVEWYTPAA